MTTTMMSLTQHNTALAEDRGLLASRWVVPVLGEVENGSVRWRGGFRPASVAPRLRLPTGARGSGHTLVDEDGDVTYDEQAYAVFAGDGAA